MCSLQTTPIAVAVSGGADSLYSLIRLQEQGFDVKALHGLFLRPEDPAAQAAAAQMRERLDAICASLGIPLYVEDLTEPFSALVIRPFIEMYALGKTPNPCVLCNAKVKFGLLLEAAHRLGAGRIATGHYAKLLHDDSEGEIGHAPALIQGADVGKDQSYFLAKVSSDTLARAVFPLEEAQKKDVLQTLQRRGIAVPQPGESQEVCFVPEDQYRAFVPRMAEKFGIDLSGPGPMLLEDGTRIGTHKGLWQYTEGQRKGLGIGWKEPLHVLGKEQGANILRLGPRASMHVGGCVCVDVNLLLPPECWPETVLVKTRYRERPKEATVALGSPYPSGLTIRFKEPETAVAPGQIAAVYVPWQGGRLRLAAGAVIERAEC